MVRRSSLGRVRMKGVVCFFLFWGSWWPMLVSRLDVFWRVQRQCHSRGYVMVGIGGMSVLIDGDEVSRSENYSGIHFVYICSH